MKVGKTIERGPTRKTNKRVSQPESGSLKNKIALKAIIKKEHFMIRILINLEGLESILSHYGIRSQIRKFAEEAYELQEAVIEQETLQEFTEQKGNFDNEHIAEELADVMVLWMQIRMHYNVNIGQIEEIVNEKIKRQIKRIENETSSI